MLFYHPGSAVLIGALVFGAISSFFASLFDQGQDFQSYASQIQVAGTELAFGDSRSGPTVVILGTMTNASPVPWKEIRFHADFFDRNGRRADVGQKEEYGFYLPARSASPFKVSFRREFPETNYAKCSVRVVTAKDGRARW